MRLDIQLGVEHDCVIMCDIQTLEAIRDALWDEAEHENEMVVGGDLSKEEVVFGPIAERISECLRELSVQRGPSAKASESQRIGGGRAESSGL